MLLKESRKAFEWYKTRHTACLQSRDSLPDTSPDRAALFYQMVLCERYITAFQGVLTKLSPNPSSSDLTPTANTHLHSQFTLSETEIVDGDLRELSRLETEELMRLAGTC